MTANPDIFLSYNREDQATAKRYADAFAAEGLNVWWDTALRSGEAYDEVTEAALRAAKAVVVLWSPRSVVSRWVRAEATIADRCKTLVPVMIEACERPIMFELTQTAELSHWTGDAGDRAWLAFLDDVRGFVGKERAALAPMPSLAAVAAKAEPAETLLAVLPFDNLSSDAEMEFFSDGVSDDILGRIMRGSKLRVIGRTSSFQFRGADKPKAAAALGASHVLDGSIRRAGNRVRIAAHLTEAKAGTTLWADKYDRDLEDIFAVQDEISEAIADALDAAFFPAKTAKIDPLAYDLYLRGKELDPNPERSRESIGLLEAAVRLAPELADAWGALAFKRCEARGLEPWADRPPLDAIITENTQRCLMLDPDNVQAAMCAWWQINPFGDYLAHHEVVQRLERIGQNSPDAMGFISYHLESVGRTRDAVVSAGKGTALDPLSQMANATYAQSLWRSGEYQKGRAELERIAEIWPDNHHNIAVLILACGHMQDWAAVDHLLDPARLERYPLRELRGVIGMMAVLRDPTIENRTRTLEAITRSVDLTGHADAMPFITLAEFDFVDEAYTLLDRAKLGPSGGPKDALGANAYRTHLLFPAVYTKLRADPRFVKLCARLGLVEYWLATQMWPDCAEVAPYDFRAECEKYRDFPKDVFFA
ncbi:MAG: TIR domain-containing protein [Novosphingobium sp.]|uniref:TIR domain-containing protein n=1 Tax=Novosphingobium sp. TaxID=1874826 RepID=UPI0032B8BA42